MKATMTPTRQRATRLQMEVFISTPETFQVTSTLVYGERDLVLIDAQFTLAEARRVADRIKATGKNLAMAYVTHGHPDHYWGLNAIREAFPEAKFVSVPEVIAVIHRLQAKELAQWKPVWGEQITGSPIIPDPLAGNQLELEGNILEIRKTVQGDVDGSSFVWIPSLKAVVAGDVVSDRVNLWLLETDKAARRLWAQALDQIEAFRPQIVVAGHAALDSRNSPAAISFTRSYLTAFDEAIESSKTAEEVVGKLKAKFPQLAGLDMELEMDAKAAFPGGK